MLGKWLLQQHGITLDTAVGMSGDEIVDSLCHALAAAGFNFDDQKSVLLEAPDVYCDADFLRACVERVKLIERLQDERREALMRHLSRCRNGVAGRHAQPPAAEVAIHRFVPCWPLTDETFSIVDDMLWRMADAGYIETNADVLRHLRQGFGYYRPSEDPFAVRRPVRWLRGQNALHWWLCGLLGDRGANPLITVSEGGVGRWITAASIFADSNGHAYTNAQLEHGRPASDDQRRWLDSVIPLRPSIQVVPTDSMS